MDSEGLLRLEKCDACGRLVPVGAEHECVARAPSRKEALAAWCKHRGLPRPLVSVLIAVAIVAVAILLVVETAKDQSEQAREDSARVAARAARESVQQVRLYYDELQPHLSEWDDAVSVAASTPAVSLAGPIGDLQQIRRDVAGMDPPTQTLIAHGKLVAAQGLSIDAFMAFMRGESQPTVDDMFQQAGAAFDDWRATVESPSEN